MIHFEPINREDLEVPDDVSIVDHLKHHAYIIEGSNTNIKLKSRDTTFQKGCHKVDRSDFGSTMDVQHDDLFDVDPFNINKCIGIVEDEGFDFMTPTTCRNDLRVLQAMQLPKPTSLEGSLGVGKTSLIIALRKGSGHKVAMKQGCWVFLDAFHLTP
ncbi:hypothetical protein V8G54_001072 [Vigna mungo]|uniref:Uncharacterized protein n=1 Tax=Vigna mungo TaxID=3915 RepID=A0AAQ3P6K9_VIGMU